jgi:dihydroorotase
VTAEVTPHHLMLTEELLSDYNPIYKVNPPLRTQSDVDAVRKGLADGVIDIVATDHAPHPIEDKECELSDAAFGMIGLESALGITAAAMIDTGQMDWAGVINRFSTAPAHIGGYENHGNEITVGSVANLVLIDTEYRDTFTREDIFSQSSNSPFLEVKVRGRVEQTIFNGKLVFNRGAGGVQ